jgi:hypothetical protein
MTIPIARAVPHTDAVVAAITAIPMLVDRAKQPAGSGWQGTPGALPAHLTHITSRSPPPQVTGLFGMP